MNTIRRNVLINMQIFSFAAIPMPMACWVIRDVFFLSGHGWVFQVIGGRLVAQDILTLSLHWRPS